MILRHLDINGYHCYKETGFDFAKEVTVLIGKNGTGKSGSPDKPGGLSIQLCKSEKKEFYIRYSS